MREGGRRLVRLVVAVTLAAPAAARAVDFGVRLEPGVAFPLADRQAAYFGVGGGAAVKVGLGYGVIDVHATGLFVGLSPNPGAPSREPGVAWAAGGGVRLKRPRGGGIVHPWLDADVFWARTGPLDRFGFAAGVGLAFPLGAARAAWLGPYARYVQIVQPEEPGFNTDDAKILLAGLSLELGNPHRPAPADPDGDGIAGEADRCPDDPEDRDGWQDGDGCPDPDNDGDTIPDRDDRCRDVPEDRDGFEDGDGCPDPDDDGDGIPDGADRCPRAAEDRDGWQDGDGCPDPDNDGDGVLDAEDKCPNVAGGRAGAGCPDRDKDGVADLVDQCPDAAGPPDNQGCPRYKQVTVTEKRLDLSEKIFFAYDKTQILPRSFPLLDEVTRALRDHPAIHVRIEGHTDAKGNARHNDRLSEGRAGAVRRYLVDHGIAADRLEAKGYGSSLPLDSNHTPEGRERNRRVEFVITRPQPARPGGHP